MDMDISDNFMPAHSAAPIQLDYAFSDTAADIDLGIRETIQGIRLSILAMGIGLARMKEKRLYRDLKFRSMSGYVERLCAENRMERSSMFNWLSIGEAYLKYQSDLDQIGFNDSDGPTKLPFIDRALEKMEKEEVFENIKNMSVREFKAFSRNKSEAESEKRRKVTIRGNTVFIGRRQAITLSKTMGKKTYEYFKKVILVAGKTFEEGGVILPVQLHDMDEARRFERAVYRLLDELRSKK
jgi:hypothetical protein